MKCSNCFYRGYSEYRYGKYFELQVIIWQCNVKPGRPTLLKLVKQKGLTIERKVALTEDCIDYSPVHWKLEGFKSITE